jgi:hypothetical protein
MANQLKSNEDLFALKVTIGLVNSPLYENIYNNGDIDDYFKGYFKVTRKHKLNDRLFAKNSLNQSN